MKQSRKQSLISLLVGTVLLTACQSQGSLPSQVQTPLTPYPQQTLQQTAQRAHQVSSQTPSQTTSSNAALPSGPVRVSAPSSTSTSNTQSAQAAPSSASETPSSPSSSPAQTGQTTQTSQTTQAEVLVSENYSIETILAGLKEGMGEAEAQAIAQKYGLTIDRFISSIRTVSYRTQGQNVTELLDKLSHEPALEFVEADQVATQKPEKESAVTDSFAVKADNVVNDDYFDKQYALPNMHVPEAWNLAQGDGAVVAVIDTGVETSHGDLDAQLVPGYDAFSHHDGPNAGDVSKLNYFMSTYKHGTHVAGIIAAETNNNKGIAGIAPHAKIMPIKIFPDFSDWIQSLLEPDEDANATIISVLADGIVWAVDHGANIINMSLSVTEKSATLERAVQYALEHNVTVVVAAGNQRHLDNARNELAAIDGVIGVGAVDEANDVAFFSNSGDYVDVAAPGVDILSTVPSFLGLKGYINMTGTSMAAPQVAGVAALILSKYGADVATPEFITHKLEETALDKGDPGRDDLYGYGVVDAYRALGGE